MEKKLIDILWIIMASGLVFIMQGGFAFVEAGLTRNKNTINVAIKNLTDLGVSIFFFWIAGFALMFGATQNGLFGSDMFLVSYSGSMWIGAFFLFQSMFCSTSATIVSGAVAERMKFSSYIISTSITSILIYPISGHWAWGGALWGKAEGWLASSGFIDFAGSTVVHSVGGWIALAILFIIGPRTGRFDENGKAVKIQGHDIPASVLGVILLWFGWFGFNGGSTLEMNAQVPTIIMNTTLATATGIVATLALGWIRYGMPDIEFVINGALAGLVAITAPCHAVSGLDASIIGGVGGVVMLLGTKGLEKFKIDDAVGAIPVHLFAGMWGTLAVALFGDPKILGTGLTFLGQLKIQTIGILSVGAWAFGVAFILLFILNRISPLRVTKEEEKMGLNVAEHGATTEIFELYSTMEEQAQTGDLTLRLPEEPFTEVGQIAQRYNSVMDNLENNLVAKTEYLNILDNVSDGLFIIDKDLSVSPYYSKALEEIFERNDIANKSLPSIFKNLVPEKTQTEMEDFLGLLFNKNFNMTTLNRLNPLNELEVFIDDEKGGFNSKFLDAAFQRIEDSGQINQVMVILRDITRETQLQSEMVEIQKKTNTEMEMFYQILHIEPTMFVEFLSTVEENIRKINIAMEEDNRNLSDVLDQIYRLVHSIKGDSNLFELEFLVKKSHEFEEKIEQLKKKEDLKSGDFLPLAVMLSELQSSLNQMKVLINRLLNFKEIFANQNSQQEELLLLSIKNLIDRLMKNSGKIVSFDYNNFNIKMVPKSIKRRLKEIIVQLVQNAMNHGIESPAERIKSGKPESGKIRISSMSDSDTLTLSLMDDGRGINFEKLREKAKEKYNLTDKEAMNLNKNELLNVIFSPGVSTAEEVNTSAGRGVGLDMIRSYIEELGARMTIKTKQNEFCEFQFHIPLNN